MTTTHNRAGGGADDGLLERIMTDVDVVEAAQEEMDAEGARVEAEAREERARRVNDALGKLKATKMAKLARTACARNEMITAAVDGLLSQARKQVETEEAQGRASADEERRVQAVFEDELHHGFVVRALRAVAGQSSVTDDGDSEDGDSDDGDGGRASAPDVTVNATQQNSLGLRDFVTAATSRKMADAAASTTARGDSTGAVDVRMAAEYLNAAQAHRRTGNELFVEKRYEKATAAYRAAFEAVRPLCPDVPEARDLMPVLASNLAASLIKGGAFEECVQVCDAAIAIAASTTTLALVKCRYRRGVAAMHLEDFDLAASDFAAVLTADPSNEEAHTRTRQLTRRRRLASGRDARVAAAALGLRLAK